MKDKRNQPVHVTRNMDAFPENLPLHTNMHAHAQFMYCRNSLKKHDNIYMKIKLIWISFLDYLLFLPVNIFYKSCPSPPTPHFQFASDATRYGVVFHLFIII